MFDQTSNNYTPTPVDTTNIQLPEELMALAEAISKNVHEVWAQNRINEGWTYGPVRDDQTYHKGLRFIKHSIYEDIICCIPQ